ncbi:MAG: serpin family protein, partial [Ruminococcus sp.]|nr:serpin family protein [Ruminococcus sp.]
MKKSISLLTAAALSLCVLGACADNGSISGSERLSEKYSRSKDTSLTYNFADGAQETPDAYNSFTNQATSLELKLFNSLFSGELKNSDKIFFSPASTVLQLGLMLNGASDDAKSELLLAFGGELGVDSLNQCSSYFKSRMESVSSLDSEKSKGDPNAEAEEPKEHVSLKNSLFVDSDCNIKTSFLQSNADFYGNDIFKLDFSSRDSLVTKLSDYSESLGKLCENNYSDISE